MAMDQDISGAALRLEQALCVGLGAKPAAAVLRNMKVKALQGSLSKQHGHANVQDAAQDIQGAVNFLLRTSPNPAALEEHLRRLDLRGAKGAKELVMLLHMLATDDTLKVLTKGKLPGSGAVDTFKGVPAPVLPSNLTSTSARATHPANGQLQPNIAAPATRQSNSQAAPVVTQQQQHLAPSLRPSQQEQPTVPRDTGSGGGSVTSGLPASFIAPGFMTPAGAPASRQAPEASPMQISPRVTLQPNEQPAATPEVVGPTASATGGLLRPAMATAQFNPMFGQESHTPSPPVRQREYTPSLSTGMAAARMRGPTVSTARPSLPATGDLFALQPPQQQSVGMTLDLPSWNTSRLYLTGMDLVQAATQQQQQQESATAAVSHEVARLADMPAGGQEVAVMNDLLYAFMGLDGKYIHATLSSNSQTGGASLSYVIQASCLQPCSQELIERLLPICEYVAVLQRFIESRSNYSQGLVVHAVCAALRALVSDWQLVVTQLEHQLRTGRLTLQGLMFYCQGPLTSLSVLAGIAAQASQQQLRGAGLLNLLSQQAAASAGDKAARTLLHKLLQAAAAPYFKMLESWLCEGVLHDPYDEFMVQESKAVDKAALTLDHKLAYWSQRYTLRLQPDSDTHDVPTFLQPVQLEILNTGKYLNAVRECGRSKATRPAPLRLQLNYDQQHAHLAAIHAAHSHASKALLHELREEQQLMVWLRSLKHFFLLDQGDVVVHLAEAARSELASDAGQLSKPRLQSLLELAVKTSSIGQDVHADALALELEPRSLAELARAAGIIQQPSTQAAANGVRLPGGGASRLSSGMCGWEVLQLSVQLQWPLTLVVPPAAMAQYQLIFRHLFQLKHVERQLAAAWLRMQTARRAKKVDRDRLRPVYQVAQRQLFFVQEMLRYSCMDVLEPAWQGMEESVRKAADVDQVINCHAAFLRKALDGLLLSYPQLLRPITDLQQSALMFSTQLQAAWDAAELQQEKLWAAQGQQLQRGSSIGGRHISGAGSSSNARSQGGGRSSHAGDAAAAQLNVDKPTQEFRTGLQALVGNLQELYKAAMHRESAVGSSTDNTALQQSHMKTREELEALQGLIQRLSIESEDQSMGSTQHTGLPAAPLLATSSTAGLPPPGTNAAIYRQMAAAAARLQ